jgi:beta-mannosidase
MFACSTYPTTDADFMATVEQEAIDNVRRLHHRACLGLWCGNNELEQGLAKGDEWTGSSMPWAEYSLLYDDMLPRIVADEDGITPYWPCSPHSPNGNRDDFNNDRCGDAHAWSVWFGGQPIESQRTWTYRFMSEFGFQSFPEPRTVEAFTDSEDRSLTNWVMDYHQRSAGGNQKIFRTLLDWFPAPKRFDETLWLTQLTQALCIQYAAEHARRLQGRMDGLLYWQLNDLWPGATWSSIDVHGRWKALHFFAARFFAPILVSLEEDHATGTVAVHVSNHRPDDFVGTVHWAVTDCAGTLRAEGSDLVDVASQSDKLVATIACQEIREAGGTERLPLEVRSSNAIPMAGDRDLLVWATVDDGGLELGRNLAFFAKPKYWQLCQPVIQTSVIDGPEGLIVHLECDVCAPWTRLEVPDHDVRFADNFVHVAPGLPIHVPVLESDGLDAVDLEQQLVVTPLIDTWQ